VLVGFLVAAFTLGACSSSPTSAGSDGSANTSTTDPTAAVNAAVITAWKAAENAIYQAGSDPNGVTSPALAATLVDPELELVKKNLAAEETQGFIGRGTWTLGSPRVISLGPTESQPTTATVTSCIDDSAILVIQQSADPASGAAGTPNWEGETSTMVLTASGWKLSQQSAVANTNRSTACAGIAS